MSIEDNIKMGVRERGCRDVDWFHVKHVTNHWLALMNTVTNLLQYLSGYLLASEEGLCSIDFVTTVPYSPVSFSGV